jgi:uroporphyrinogen-III synthase
MPRNATTLPLSGCYVISLRPVGGHAGLREAAARHGAKLIALSPWRLSFRDDDATRTALRDALHAPAVVFTSPAAAQAAAALQPLQRRAGQRFLAVGTGTARALRLAGIDEVTAPVRMDSDGLLALPAFAQVGGTDVGLVTAPGGRGRIEAVLLARGAGVRRADVYERVHRVPPARAVATLARLEAPALLALSSGEALQWILGVLPAGPLERLRGARVLAASERLAALAGKHGFVDIVRADSARPADLLAAAARAATGPLRADPSAR